MSEPWDDEIAAIALVRQVSSKSEAGTLTKEDWFDAVDRLEALTGDSEPLQEYASDDWLEEYAGDES